MILSSIVNSNIRRGTTTTTTTNTTTTTPATTTTTTTTISTTFIVTMTVKVLTHPQFLVNTFSSIESPETTRICSKSRSGSQQALKNVGKFIRNTNLCKETHNFRKHLLGKLSWEFLCINLVFIIKLPTFVRAS